MSRDILGGGDEASNLVRKGEVTQGGYCLPVLCTLAAQSRGRRMYGWCQVLTMEISVLTRVS